MGGQICCDAGVQGLKDAGFFEGGNISIKIRWEDGHYDRLPSVAAELVGRNDVPSAFAAKAATQTIPIVFATGELRRHPRRSISAGRNLRRKNSQGHQVG
jgi:hypothetical protein